MPTVTGESTVHLETTIASGNFGFAMSPEDRWMVTATIGLTSGDIYESSIGISHPTRSYSGRVKEWGSVEMSVGVPAGQPQISDGKIRVIDTDNRLRNLILQYTPRRKPIQLKLIRENTSESLWPVFFRGEIIDHAKGPGYMELGFRDRQSAWLDEKIDGVITRARFPELAPGVDEAFLNIIFGINVSPVDNPTGVIPCPHIGFNASQGDRFGLAQHECASVPAVYRQVGNTDVTLVNPDEYAITTADYTFNNIDYTLSFIDFPLEQPPGTKITADVHGIFFRGSWNGYPLVGYHPTENPTAPIVALRNVIDHYINMTFLAMRNKAGAAEDFQAGVIMRLREIYEDNQWYSDGALTKSITNREFLGQILGELCLVQCQTFEGQLTLGFIGEHDDTRPHFKQKRYVERSTFEERRADPTVNQINYGFAQNYVTGEFAESDQYNNTADQEALGEIEPETGDVGFRYVRDAATAADMTELRARYLALGSYRQSWTMPTPEVYTKVGLLRPIGLTHRDGMASGGYHNEELITTNLRFNLDRWRTDIKSIRRLPATLQAAPAEATARPLSYEEWEDDPPVNPARSYISNGDKAIDADAGYGLSATYSELTFVSSTATAMHAQLFLSNIQSTPPAGFSNLIIHVVASNVAGVSTIGPGPAISGIVQQYRDNSIPGQPGYDPAFAGAIFDLDYTVTTPPTEYTKTFTAAEFATYFSSSSANIVLRFNQWNTALIQTSVPYLLRIWDAWVTWS